MAHCPILGGAAVSYYDLYEPEDPGLWQQETGDPKGAAPARCRSCSHIFAADELDPPPCGGKQRICSDCERVHVLVCRICRPAPKPRPPRTPVAGIPRQAANTAALEGAN